ncbi:MAG: DUF1361 domain-containing protein [Deltaproteobacteria bacterium]|nr:DUF1361 domain-containing protein [Deltaproteobacteria bacterium]
MLNDNHFLMSFFLKQIRLYAPLLLASCFSVTLLMLRLYYTQSSIYLFLLWNLFLAFVPLYISFFLHLMKKNFAQNLYLKIIFLPLWLLFFPNSLYLVTDFLHLTPKNPIPLWFDLLLLLSFSWAGLLAAFISLKTIQDLMELAYEKSWAWLWTAFVLLASSFGVYLGRFLRWNSWDIFFNPMGVLADVAPRVFLPWRHPSTFAVTFLYASFFLIAYLAFYLKADLALSTKSRD